MCIFLVLQTKQNEKKLYNFINYSYGTHLRRELNTTQNNGTDTESRESQLSIELFPVTKEYLFFQRIFGHTLTAANQVSNENRTDRYWFPNPTE
jgi:hypothetical protein